jgi:hypothetical protein
MTPFQGDSKKRTEQDINDLATSLKEDGLLQPFSLWRSPDDQVKILDGHGRLQALVKIALTDPAILQQEFPVNWIEAETEEEAVKACLQMMSTYGRVNRPGVIKFAAQLTNYKAPVVQRALHKPIKREASISDDKVLIRIRIPKDKVKEFTALIKQVSFIEVY